MIITVECPSCQNKGLKIDINSDEKVVTSGRKLGDLPMKVRCKVCKRTIKYDVVKKEA